MTTIATPQPVTTNRRGTIVLLVIAGATALTFFAVAALPYYLSSAYNTPGADYSNRRGWLMLHIVGGSVALLTGPLQLWLGLADRSVTWHRRMGYGYMTAIAVSSVGAFYLATHTDGGLGFGSGLFALAIAWLSTTGLAFLAIRRSLYDQHKEWMIRSYVVTFGFVLFRITYPALQSAGIGSITDQLAVAAWGCWSVPLLVTELFLQGRKILRVSA